MKILPLCLSLAFLAIGPSALAQDFPRFGKALPPINLNKGGRSTTIDLSDAFAVDNVHGPLVEYSLHFGGEIFLELYPDVAPHTVANFLSYVNEGKYNLSFIHYSEAGFVIWGGSYYNDFSQIVRKPSVVNEFKLSNLPGTIAMAKAADPNSATSEWFFNLGNNTSLDAPDKVFTVFGRLIGNGLSIANEIAALPVKNLNPSDDPTGPLTRVPIVTDTSTEPDSEFLLSIDQMRLVPLVKLVPSSGGYLTITAASSNTRGVKAQLTSTGLKLTSGSKVGTATIRVRATDPYDRWVETAFVATSVNSRLPLVSIRTTASTITEGGRKRSKFRISRTGSRSKSLKVRLATTGSTAKSGSDVVKVLSTATIPAGKTYVDVPLIAKNDSRAEGVEYFVETLMTSSSYTTSPTRAASVTILDDDVPTVTMTVIDGILGEANSNSGLIRFTRTGSKAAALPIYVSVDGNATLGTDYTVTPTLLGIPAGQASVNASFSPVADVIKEGTEKIVVTAAPVSFYNIPSKPVTLTLLDKP